MVLIGCDFSINKPACCIFKDNKFHFISWPHDLPKSVLKIYSSSPSIKIIERIDVKEQSSDVSAKLRFEVKNSKYLSNLILLTLSEYIEEKNTFMAFEGLSYGSGGDSGIQLGAYKYVLMDELIKIIPLENMYTYAPITIKKTAGCSQKGKTKSDMIEAFKKTEDTEFSKYICNNEDLFKTKKGNWITHLDDIIDAYWALETLKLKLFPF